jgi:hypothetical protein
VILFGYGSAHRNGIGVVRLGQKQTCAAHERMSAKGQKRNDESNAVSPLFVDFSR